VDFDESGWNIIRPKTDGDTGELCLRDWQTAVFRAHINLTDADLANPGVQLRFAGIDDEGFVYVNGRRVGESSDWQDSPCFDVKQAMRPGDNVIAVGVRNYDGTGGIKSDVNVEFISRPVCEAWSRSLFNGLAQIIVQSSRDAGSIKLTAIAEGLKPTTATITTLPCTPRSALP
jgi:beta-galactosidase